jgi:hypothetical protein
MFCKVISLGKDGAEIAYAGRPGNFSTEGGQGLNEDSSLNCPDVILEFDREKHGTKAYMWRQPAMRAPFKG